jgi:hypothetical protein
MTTSSKVLAETPLYKITIEQVKSQLTLNGTDEIYAITNKETGVVEGRGATLPDALGFMHSVQIGYENIIKQATQLEDSQGLPPEHTRN